MASTNANLDNMFGPQYGHHFDFTLLFESAIFTMLPTAILLAICPFHLLHYKRQPARSNRSPLLYVKLAVSVIILVLEVTKSALWSELPEFQTVASTAGNSLACLAAFCVSIMLAFEHRYALQSSMPLSLYLSAVTIADVVQARSQLMRPGLQIPAIITTATAVLKFILVILLEVPKKLGPNIQPNDRYNPESTGGFWNRTLVLWINLTLCNGFTKDIQMKDLTPLGPEFNSQRLSERFSVQWQKANKKSKYCILRSIIKVLLWPFMVTVIPRFALLVFSFLTPVIMKNILHYVQDMSQGGDAMEKYPKYTRAGLIISFAVAYQGIAISKVSALHFKSRFASLAKGTLVSQIIKKQLRLRRQDSQTASALSLMTTDVEGIVFHVADLHGAWIAFLECGLSMYFLYQEIGVAGIFPLITMATSMILSHMFGQSMLPAKQDWNKAIEDRVSRTAAAFANVKALKMMGLEYLVKTILTGLRKTEIQRSLILRKLEVRRIATMPLIFMLTPTLTITAALFLTPMSHGLDATTVFITMAYLFLFYQPLHYLVAFVPSMATALACLARVQDYLLLDEHIDTRIVKNCSQPSVSGSTSPEVASMSGTVQQSQNQSTTGPCISFVDASVGEKLPGKSILQRVNIDIGCSSIVMVIGPVASGKSTLLKTIIGESDIVGGELRIDGSTVAYAGERAWLPNTTIRQTILGANEFNSDWYAVVLRACALEEDIEQLSNGDQTIVGSNGATVSGGQRQRLALARAVYSRAAIVVLDDIISGLDQTTASSIIAQIFSPNGLLKNQGRTAIMATHSVQYLSVADQILMVNGEGQVTSEDGESTLPETLQELLPGSTTTQSKPQELSVPNEVRALQEQMLIQGSRGGDWTLYPFFLQDVPKPHIWVFIALIFFVALLERSIPIYLSIWIQLDATNKYYIAGMCALLFVSIWANFAAARAFFIGIIPTISTSMHSIFMNTTMGATVPYLTSTGLGGLLNRASQDMTLLGDDLPMAFYRMMYIVGIVVTDTGVVLSGTRYAIALLPVMIVVLGLVQSFYLRTSRQIRRLDLEAKTPLYEKINETLTGLEHIRCFGWEERTLKDSLALLDASQTPYYYMFAMQRWLGLILDSISTAVGTIIVTIAVSKPELTSNASLGLSLMGIFAYSIAVMCLIERWTHLETSLGAAARLRDFEKSTPVEKDGPNVEDQPEGWGKVGRVEFKNVTAQYKLNKSVHTALKDLTLTVEPGQKAVIKGRTGSGKSSLILTLLNFLEYSGSVFVDGVDISTVPRAQLRHRITTISQDVPELSGSVRDNILPLDALKPPGEEGKVNPEIVDMILEGVELYDHIMENGGLDEPFAKMNFSAGQKQLVALARGMLHHLEYETMIILMDEATSNLDIDMDAIMQSVMDASFGDCTRFVVCHKSLSLMGCDLFLEFSEGKLIHEVNVAEWRVDDEISRRIKAERAAAAANGEGSSNGAKVLKKT